MLDRLSADSRAVTASSPPVLEPSDDARTAVPSAVRSAVDGVPRPARPRVVTPAQVEPGAALRVGSRAQEALDFVRAHLVAVVALAVAALVATGWWMWSARAVPVPVEAREEAGPAASRAGGQPTGMATAPASGATVAASAGAGAAPLRVHVFGAVRRPGVVELAPGARVADAIEAAGGLSATARPAELNLAQHVGDGQQIVIGTRAKPAGEVRQGSAQGAPGAVGVPGGGGVAGGGSTPGGGAAGCVDVNTASASALEELPGVGPKTAEKIIARRTEKGVFSRPEELQEVPGIGPKTFAELETGVCR